MNAAAPTRPDEDRVLIGDQPVGAGCPPYVIAEAGVNHDGDVDCALRLVDEACAAGADAVKFQVFRAEALAVASARTADYQQRCSGATQREMLARLELSDDEFQRVRSHCAVRGIEFLATPFSRGDLRRLNELGVRAIKIASTDLNNMPLLCEAATSGRPLIISTGAATESEIHACVSRLREFGVGQGLVLLHCVSCYPTPLEAANLGAIETLRRVFGVPSGYSDHTTSTLIGAWAVAAGASVLEKHFTLDRSAPGPDHAMSLEPTELRDYIEGARSAWRSLGSGTLGMTDLEADVRAVARKSVVSAQDLFAGAVLRPEMLTIKRPGGGVEPDRLEELFGRRVSVDVARDTVLTWDMIL